MKQPELILLSPYQLPGQNPLALNPEDMAAWMNGYSALWHPAALWQAAEPPRVESAYDHEDPKPGHVYVLPESPPLVLPEDWDQRVRQAGSLAVRATTDRPTTLARLLEALRTLEAPAEPEAGEEIQVRPALLDLPPEQVRPFLGIGLGYLVIDTLCEAMEHENLLAEAEFWADVQRAVAALAGVPFIPAEETPPPEPDMFAEPSGAEGDGGAGGYEAMEYEGAGEYPEPGGLVDTPPDNGEVPEEGAEVAPEPESAFGPEASRRHLQAAADRLTAAREVLYPVTIHLLDLLLLNEQNPGAPLPASAAAGFALNVLASGATLEKLNQEQPEKLAHLREKIQSEQVEVCGGVYLEREDALLPVESQVWNLVKGLTVSRELLGADLRVFARQRGAAHPQLPMLLNHVGLQRALLVAFDDSTLPSYQVTVINWPSPDGKQIEAFTRQPVPADSPQAFFHMAHHLFQTIRQDHSATVAFLHRGGTPPPWYEDWLELCRFGPVLGQWTTFTHYFNDVLAGEHASSLSPDEFQHDYLSQRTAAHRDDPVSGFARQVRRRRRLDTTWTLAAFLRGLAGRNDPLRLNQQLAEVEELAETTGRDPEPALEEMEKKVGETLAGRLLARAQGGQPGYLILNPCSFARRVALELDGVAAPLPLTPPVKACQLDGDRLMLVAEVPALGFAWFPRSGPPGTPAPPTRMRLADARCVRNEFFEAEVDPETGGLRAFRDHRARNNRLGQRLVFNPGSTMRATSATTTSTGPALGEIVTEGVLLGEQQQVLARYRQRFRAWLGRPVLDLRIELFPEQPPAGNPWHAYFGARFAWRDERAMLLRGVNGSSYVTTQARPVTPDYLEVRQSRQSTVIFPGGLPFQQRQENRMVDVLLVTPGEKANVFDLALALDREFPMQTALGMVTPVPLVPTTQGPPHVGPTGWLFHLDATNLLLLGLRPVSKGEGTLADAVQVRLLECGAYGGQAQLRCPRDPRRALFLDALGGHLQEAVTQGDTATFDVLPGDLVNLQVEFRP